MNQNQLGLAFAGQSRQLLFQRNLDNLSWAESQRKMLVYQFSETSEQLMQAEVLRQQNRQNLQ